jgi:hypothetical protein
MIQLADVAEICKASDGNRPQLESILIEIVSTLAKLSEFLGEIYFSHALSSGPLLSGTLEQSS